MTEPIRIAYLTNDSKLAGTERVILSLAERLDRERFEPSVICLKPEGDLNRAARERGIETHALGMQTPLSAIRGAVCLADLLRRIQPDVLVTYLFYSNLLGRVVGRMRRVPVIVSGQEGMDEWRKGYHNALDSWTARWVRTVVTNSQAVKERYIRHTGLCEDKIEVIYNGLDIQRFDLIAGSAEGEPTDVSLREEFGIAEEVPVLGHVANFTQEKDHPNLLRALRILKDRGVLFCALLSGSGTHLEATRALRDDLGLAEYVHFLGYRHNIERLVGQFDLVTLSSYEEGMPVSLLEAMAARRAIVATRAGGIPEVVIDGETGLLAPIRDPESLATAYEKVLTDPDLRQRLGDCGRARLVERFSLATQVHAHQTLYATLLSPRS